MMPKSAGFAPIALFVFRRVQPLIQTLDALEACPEFGRSPVYIFSDAAKTPAQIVQVEAVRALIERRRTENMTIVHAEQNIGLAESVIRGVSYICKQYGRVIVIEDDLVVSPAILEWLNIGLDKFADNNKVMQISGHMFHVPSIAKRKEGLFLPFTTSWGWATWQRAWAAFDPLAEGWQELYRDKELRRRFDLDNHYAYSRMLKLQMQGELDSWAIRWYWSVFCRAGVCLFPPQTMVRNIGADQYATHERFVKRLPALFRQSPPVKGQLPTIPNEVDVDHASWRAVTRAIGYSRWMSN